MQTGLALNTDGLAVDDAQTRRKNYVPNDAVAAAEVLTDESDAEWFELLEQDRERAFVLLVERYRTEIFDLCVRISGNRSEAEDLTQETFIKAYQNLGSFRRDARMRTWLYRIAINRSISFTRRLKRWRMQRGNDEEIFPELPELANPSAEQETEWKDLAEKAHEALHELSPRQRTAVILRVLKEMTYEDVAAAMGTSVGGAKANVFQGLKKLRATLEEQS